MKKHLPNKFFVDKKIKKPGPLNPIIISILKSLNKKICFYLGIKSNQGKKLLQNYTIKLELSGCNNNVCILNFYDDYKNFLGDLCLKYSFMKEKKEGLCAEFNILNILYANNISCPSIIGANFLDKQNLSYILMETIRGGNINGRNLNIQEAESILSTIKLHELILQDNLQTLQLLLPAISDLYKEIDFKNKLLNFLSIFTPDFIVRDSLDFFNYHFNSSETIKKRMIVTDRSVDNIFMGQDGKITIIDFSTIRIGTQFDNWIQFIDDPRITFSCSKEDLISLFFKKNSLSEKELNSFYVSSIYTNLLQGIFTYQKNPQLGIGYINNANNSFKKLTKKNGVLIDINL